MFCGRERELARLDEAWAAVAEGDGGEPQVVALVAESGLGKTRVVQEFYRRLAARMQGETVRYWPPTLGQVDDNLQVHVEPSTCDPSAPVPFLWWGLRVPDPGARNQAVVGQFAAAVDHFTPHLAPLYRTRRRREHQQAIGKTVGKVVLDIAIDAVPFAGLFKTIGETAFELGQGAHGWWAERQAPAPADVLAQQRDDLVTRMVADIGVVVSRREADTLAVPAVLVLDDGHFAQPDSSELAFLDRVLSEARAHRWPVLVIVTCWTAEWHRDAAAPLDEGLTAAGVVLRHATALDPSWTPTLLGPVEDLAPVLRAALPGLTPPQASALLERAGGNPRFLDEIVRWCARNAKVFDGRRLDAALTDRGLDTLLEKTVALHDLVEERLLSLEPEVRRALLLASLQGQEFVEPLVQEVAAALDAADGDGRALEWAERPHAFIRREAGVLGAFTQRVFHEVAVRCVGNEFDEDDVAEALRLVVRRRMLDVSALDAAPMALSLRTCMLAARLFAASDAASERHIAAYALARLVSAHGAHHEYALAWQCARQLADALDTLDADTVYWYMYYQAADTLRQHGDAARARLLVERAIAAQRRRCGQAGAAHAEHQSLSLLLKLHGEASRDLGDLQIARASFDEALEIDRAALAWSDSPWADRDLMVSMLNVAQISRQCGDAHGTLTLRQDALTIARARFEREATRDTREDLALCITAVADVHRDLGERAALPAAYADALAHRRAIVAETDDDMARAALATALERAGTSSLEAGDSLAARDAFAESLPLRRTLAEEQGTPAARIALAEVLRHLGDVARTGEDWTSALQAYGESWEVSAAACEAQVTPHGHRTRSLALERLATTAFAADSLDEAETILRDRLDLDVPYAEEVQTPALWRDVAASHYWLSRVLQTRGDLEEAREQAHLALLLFTDLHDHVGTPDTGDDLARAQRQVEALTPR